jgi:magnesium transporter
MPPIGNKTLPVAQLFVPELKELLAARQFKEIKQLLKIISSLDLADVWSCFLAEEKILLFHLQSSRSAVNFFEELDSEEQVFLLNALENNELERLIGDLKPEEAAQLFNRVPERTIKAFGRFLQRGQKESVKELASYPEHSVGNWMHLQQVDMKPDLTSSQAIEKIRTIHRLRQGGSPDGYYVTDKTGRVAGFVSLRELIAAPSATTLGEYMNPVRLFQLMPSQDPEDAIQLFTTYKLSMAPVVDENRQFLGYIKAEDIIPLAQQESTEDIQKLGAVEALDEPYFKIAFFKMIQKRGTWLCVLFIGELLTATAMGFFESEIAKATVLALFIPLIISSGGNSGSQAATLIVRAMALKEVGLKDWWHVMRRELASGFVLGSMLGALGFLRIFLWSQVSNIYGVHYLLVASTVGASLVLVVLWGSLTGSLLPLFLRRVGLDPAVVSAPFVATLVDVTGLVIYFSVALYVLKGTLL